MGAHASRPAPSDEDFLVQHQTMASFLYDKPPAEEYRILVPRKIWTNKVKSVEDVGVKLSADGKTQCVLADKNGVVHAVLLADVDNNRMIQVCSFSPSEKGAASVGQYQGRSLYEYGVATRDNNNRHLVILKVSGGNGVTFRTETYGSCLPKHVSGFTVKRDGLVCASFEPSKVSNEKVWDCRIGRGGIEEWLLIALLACFDKFPQMDEEFLRRSSGMMSYRYQNVLK